MSAGDTVTDTVGRAPQWLARLLFALGAGAIGAGLNAWPLALGPDVNLWLGNAAFVLVAARLRAPYALLAALLAVTPIYLYWGFAGPVLLFAAEALAVAMLRGRGLPVFWADGLFWLLVGVPVTVLMIWVGDVVTPQQSVYVSLKQAFNGVICSSLATVLLMLAPHGVRFAWTQQPGEQRSHRERIVYAVTVVTAFAIASSSLLLSRWMVRHEESVIAIRLGESSSYLARQVENYVAVHVRNVEGLARWLSLAQDEPMAMQRLLGTNHEVQPGFLTMLASDAAGRIVAASPVTRMATMASDYSVADRDYFREAMRSPRVYVSPVFRGRGFGSDPIVAVSRAYYRGEDGTVPLGVVEGSLDLDMLEHVVTAELDSYPIEVVLVDAAGLVIHASPGLGFSPLEAFAASEGGGRRATPGTLTLQPPGGPQTTYLASSVELDNHWRMYALLPQRALTARIDQLYLVSSLLLGAAIVLSALLAERSGRRLTAPLERIARDLAGMGAHGDLGLGALAPDASREVAVVHAELARSIAQLREYRDEMESRIAARTSELAEANVKLRALASADPLTGLHNRRSMDERFGLFRAMAERSGLQIAVVLLDLDHFKQLNDRHGHLAGDQCLVRVAGLMQDEFRRTTDIAARFGGEEFVLLTGGMTRDDLARKLDALRERIAAQEIVGVDGSRVRFTASFGALIAAAGFSVRLDDWLRVADGCLYRAKAAGRDTVVIEDGAQAPC